MKTRTFVALAISGLVVCSLGAAAAPRIAGGDETFHPLRSFIRGQVGRLMTLQSELDVTPQQREQIRQIVEGHRAEILTVAKPIIDTRRALRDATLDKSGDEAAIRTAANNLGKAIGDAAVLASKVKAEVNKVMTPEQMQKVEEFRKQSDTAVESFVEKIAKQI